MALADFPGRAPDQRASSHEQITGRQWHAHPTWTPTNFGTRSERWPESDMQGHAKADTLAHIPAARESDGRRNRAKSGGQRADPAVTPPGHDPGKLITRFCNKRIGREGSLPRPRRARSGRPKATRESPTTGRQGGNIVAPAPTRPGRVQSPRLASYHPKVGHSEVLTIGRHNR